MYYLQLDYTTLAIFLVYFADIDAHNQDINRQTFRGAESGFCLWQELRILNQKIAQLGDDLDFYSKMVRRAGLEPAQLFRPRDFKSLVSTNSTIRAYFLNQFVKFC